MGATYRHDQVRVEWAASDLGFQIGMAVDRALMREAIRCAGAREDKLVNVDDIKSALMSLNVQEILEAAERALHAKTKSRRASAA